MLYRVETEVSELQRKGSGRNGKKVWEDKSRGGEGGLLLKQGLNCRRRRNVSDKREDSWGKKKG